MPDTAQENLPLSHQTEKPGRATFFAVTALLTLIMVFVCLIPKAENDLFFELRIGTDILRSGHLPHADSYSWTNRGTRWDVPEWLSFVLYALAFKESGFFGTWLLMVLLTIGAVWVVWFWLARYVSLPWAWGLANLTLLAMSDCIQERPYAWSYLLLPTALILLTLGRGGGAKWQDRETLYRHPRILLWLIPLCALWANLHQGVLVLIGLLVVYGTGDLLGAAWTRFQIMRQPAPDLLLSAEEGRELPELPNANRWRLPAASALRMLGMTSACACAAICSPYGWRIYWNVFITLRNRNLMTNVTEWNSVLVLPFAQAQAFLLLAAAAFACLAFSRRRNLPDILAVTALFCQSLLHARDIALFAVGAMVIIAPHMASCLEAVQSVRFASSQRLRHALLTCVAALYVVTVAVSGVAGLRSAIGPSGYSPEGIGEAVAREPSYPENACAFVQREGFPANLRLYNNFELGGYLMWRLPSEPVFVDGRLDVYVGKTFDSMLILDHDGGSPRWAALVRQYDLDCVITTTKREAVAFAADPQWQLVYADPVIPHHQTCRILLRRRPEFRTLIARCLRDRPLSGNGL